MIKLPLECQHLALASHHHHRCLFSSFCFGRFESSFCENHKYKDALPKSLKRQGKNCQTHVLHQRPFMLFFYILIIWKILYTSPSQQGPRAESVKGCYSYDFIHKHNWFTKISHQKNWCIQSYCTAVNLAQEMLLPQSLFPLAKTTI